MRRVRGILALCLVATSAAVLSPAPARAATQQLHVNLAQETGPVFHGATGALYGLSDDGVPSDNTLAPLNLRTINQKAPDGLQHPNGDALVVADPFLRTGGDEVHIYLQDIYPTWPYDDLGIDDYVSKLDVMVRKVVAHPQHDRFVYVPFNEPDQIWYHTGTSNEADYIRNRDRFFADWKRVYQLIHAIDPQARIVGPNEAGFHPRFLREFLTWTGQEGVRPDVVSWHELSSSSLRDYRGHYATYRTIEREVGVRPIPININEYGNRRDMSVPGQLVQWVSMFEDTKVDANMPYWDIDTNYASHVVETNQANGGWWLLKWYGDLSGNTVTVTPPQPSTIDTLQGVAALDTAKRQAHVLLGGTADPVDVVVEGARGQVFGNRVRARVEKITWSGYDGDAPAPQLVSEQVLKVSGDRVTVAVPGGDPMAAYRIVLMPGGGRDAVDPVVRPWTASYEAENATLTSATVYTQGTPSNANGYATSGTRDVGSINSADSAVDFQVTVPAAGTYRLGILYGNQSGGIAKQALRVDGRLAQVVDYPETLNWLYRDRRDVTLQLPAGTHSVTLATSDPSTGRLAGEVTLDRLDVTAVPATPATDTYQAELAALRGDTQVQYGGTGHSWVRQGGSGVTEFVVRAAEDGYYDLALTYSASAGRRGGGLQLSLGGATVPSGLLPAGGAGWQSRTARVYLPAGINRIAFANSGINATRLDALRVTRAPAGDSAVQTIEAEAAGNALTAGAAVRTGPGASGGAFVGGIGNGGKLAVRGVTAATAGTYQLAVHYANNERAAGHPYNANLVSRAADITTTGGPGTRVWYRNTYNWTNFWSVVTPVTLVRGGNTITFGNGNAWAPDIDRVSVAPLLLTVR